MPRRHTGDRSTILEDQNRGVRRAAAAALGKLRDGSPLVIAALQRAAGDSDISLGRAAQRQLGTLRG
jgi:HEAT repeat protein